MKYGAGVNGPMRTLGQYMLGSGATFGCVMLSDASQAGVFDADMERFFMSIGSVIRTEGHSTAAAEAYARARRQPMVLPRGYRRIPGEGENGSQ